MWAVRNEEKARTKLGTDIDFVRNSTFKGVRKVINAVSSVERKDMNLRDKNTFRFDALFLYIPPPPRSRSQIKGDSPELVEYTGMKNLINDVKDSVKLENGKLLFVGGALDDVVVGVVSESNFIVDLTGGPFEHSSVHSTACNSKKQESSLNSELAFGLFMLVLFGVNRPERPGLDLSKQPPDVRVNKELDLILTYKLKTENLRTSFSQKLRIKSRRCLISHLSYFLKSTVQRTFHNRSPESSTIERLQRNLKDGITGKEALEQSNNCALWCKKSGALKRWRPDSTFLVIELKLRHVNVPVKKLV
ncbi:LOW QUALITY PROTEIN: hypothetical protein HID58_029496 [Brassica napus]|uniref:Uncharacterized protein n=1 Tax=Brassica napus TaxID=3708 RepID=A0ABQ8CD96_BRANA|nr:LOW QUALITY PROTEIN: hypothetical protein HID58_029496 [Brassica napus]